MHSLREMQQDFAEAILTRDASTLAPYINGAHAESCAMLYANTVYGTLSKALDAIYPVIVRLLGVRCFEGVAWRFIKQFPSRSGDLHHFGAEFADFLVSTSLSVDYPYLPDVALLEWQMHRIFHAVDSTPLDIQQLMSISPDHYADLCFTLAPAAALLVSPYPIHLIWQANQAGQDGSAEISFEVNRLLLLRVDGRIEIAPLSAGEYALFATLQEGNSIGVAMEAAIAVEAEFDLQSILVREIARGLITGFTLPSQ